MAAALVRYIFSYRDQGPGWTESWYGPSIPTKAQAYALIQSYLQARMPLNAAGIYSNYQKASLLDGSGVSYKFRFNYYTTFGGAAPVDGSMNLIKGVTPVTPILAANPSRPYSTLMLTYTVAGASSKRIYLSGIPNGIITDPFGPTFVPGYLPQLNAFTTVLTTNNLGWNTRRGPGALVKYPIVQVGTGSTGISVAGTPGFAVNSVVQVGGFRGLKGYRGKFRVESSTGGNVVLFGYTATEALAAPPASYIQQVGVNYIACPNTIDDYQEVSHRRGKGLGLPVGRRKARSN